jgi:hypothetical protein
VQAVDSLKKWVAKSKQTRTRWQHARAHTPNQPAIREPEAEEHPIDHYLLLPLYEFGVADWHLNISVPSSKNIAHSGFLPHRSAMASRVTLSAMPRLSPKKYSTNYARPGSYVERISGDGTSIASLLAER